ncbi:mechanosensitive ion channel family protein [Pseudaestuariivita atlantica]|uniref:Mechanosensitive ion channel protein MscS n=1 Tax=Pseudaestuariivita atlantica TaxID=1317121 RepID=A0A0L1JPB1_9RHOB|nr:mechanosensitive ion channel domain-containing protein [Pseudaestuariivita atlantica]KNG93561.1 mechanosensitive ion channel protein MscS [Pseudaestuariivita atlantica]
MEFDLASQPEFVQQAVGYAQQAWDISKTWLLSPAAWSQFGLLLAAFLLAWFVNRQVQPVLSRLLTPAEDQTGILATIRRFIGGFLPLLLPLLAFVFTAIGEQIVRSIFESGAVIAFGKRVFLFLAVRAFARDMVRDPFLKLIARFFFVPVAGLYALGLLDLVIEKLRTTIVPLGNMSFDLLWMVQFIIIGGLIFWMGRWSNDQSSGYINAQDEMRPAQRQLAVKAAEIAIFGIAFLVLMNIMEINLASLAVLGGAVGVGLGFGLQKIAANFISGVILLLEGQATVGDYVELDDGQSGTIVKTTARAMFLETYDGKWIVVPNEDFITTRVTNYSDQGSSNRYEAPFSVSYDTDINEVPALVEAAVAKHPGVLDEPFPPDCELRGFGESGVDFAVEFWVNGIDDGPNKYTSDVLFLIWNALKAEGIEIPYPQRVVELKGMDKVPGT